MFLSCKLQSLEQRRLPLTLTPESFVASEEGVCYDPLGGLGALIRSDPELSQAYAESMGLTELPPPCDGPEVGTVGLSGSMEVEITPASLESNTSVAIRSADIAVDELLKLYFNLGFFGEVNTQIDSAHLNIHAPTTSPQALSEVNPDGSFSLDSHEFSIDGGIANSTTIGVYESVFDEDPGAGGPLDLTENPIPLIHQIRSSSNLQLVDVEINGILDGGPGPGELRVYIPFALRLPIPDAVPAFSETVPASWARFEGMIVATGTSPFAMPPSSLLTVPEPSTMVMGMSAVLLLGFVGWRTHGRSLRSRSSS